MKKFGLSILASILFLNVNAQINKPGELNCTEEALTFRTSFSSGWHFSKPVLSQQRIQVITPEFTTPGLFPLKSITPKVPEQQMFERPLFRFRQPINPILPNKPLFAGSFNFAPKNLPGYQFPDTLYFRPVVRSLNNLPDCR